MDELRTRARELRNNATDAERRLWRHLRAGQLDGCRFRRQVPIAGYIADFVCPQRKLVVELDGGQHVQAVEYDARRTVLLEARGYRVLRYWNDDVLLRTTEVLEDILRNVKSTPPQPSPSLREREGAGSTVRGLSAVDSLCEREGAGATARRTSARLSVVATGRAGEECA